MTRSVIFSHLISFDPLFSYLFPPEPYQIKIKSHPDMVGSLTISGREKQKGVKEQNPDFILLGKIRCGMLCTRYVFGRYSRYSRYFGDMSIHQDDGKYLLGTCSTLFFRLEPLR